MQKFDRRNTYTPPDTAPDYVGRCREATHSEILKAYGLEEITESESLDGGELEDPIKPKPVHERVKRFLNLEL